MRPAWAPTPHRDLQEHLTVKPVEMLKDALLDMTNRDDIVLDPFLGSGSTLIAAEKIGPCCRGPELDPRYVDVILRRYQQVTGKQGALREIGETVVLHDQQHCHDLLAPRTVGRT